MKVPAKNIISFSSFDEQMVRHVFGIRQELKENMLLGWEKKAETVIITDEEQKLLQKFHHKLNLFVRAWNEEELKLKFIAQLLDLVNFDDYDLEISAFSERSLGILYKNNTEIKGFADLMVATGISRPEQPFFFIHEYKREQDSAGDPVGQLLSSMCVAVELNKQPKPLALFRKQKDFSNIPLYGVYVLGRFWFFLILKEGRYFISKSNDSKDLDDLKEIFKFLKSQKEMIMELVRNLK